jgi:ABC-2 type transport system ATP-binding protein
VTLSLERGDVVAVLGKNGAGKSTLLRCVAGLVLPTRGRVLACGHDCAQAGPRLRRDVSYIASDPRSFSWRLSGRANLAFFAALHGVPATRVDETLALVALSAADAARRVEGYSTGMRARLAIARGLLGVARVLLFDEPTAGLDRNAARSLRALVRERADAGQTVLLATHSVEDAEELAGRALVLDGGRVVYSGPPAGAREALDAHG